jgi:hypothetical protein
MTHPAVILIDQIFTRVLDDHHLANKEQHYPLQRSQISMKGTFCELRRKHFLLTNTKN